MPRDLFAGIPVSDYTRALPWYEALLGSEPTFLAHATEAVRKVTFRDADGNEISFGGAPADG
jgi:hypothetical protein